MNIKKNGLNSNGSDITEMVINSIINHFFSTNICCLKNISNKKIAVGNPVLANKNIIELLLPLSETSIFASIPKKEFSS